MHRIQYFFFSSMDFFCFFLASPAMEGGMLELLRMGVIVKGEKKGRGFGEIGREG